MSDQQPLPDSWAPTDRVGPYHADGFAVMDRLGRLVAVVHESVANREEEAKRIALDLNLGDSVAAEGDKFQTAAALYRRDAGETLLASVEFCAAFSPVELRELLAKGVTLAGMLGKNGGRLLVPKFGGAS